MEKQKATRIANLKHVRDLAVIIEVEYKSQVRAVVGLGAKENHLIRWFNSCVGFKILQGLGISNLC